MREARTESRESKSTQASANFDLVAIAEQLSRAMPADAAVDDPVLAEIRHELGNHFHKLYYWAEYVQELGGGEEAETLEYPLTGAIQKLENFLDRAMQYLTPAPIEPVGMRIGDVARAIEQLFGVEVPQAKIAVALVDGIEGREIRIDPGRFSSVIQTVARALSQTSDGSLLWYQLSIAEIEALRGVEFRMTAAPALSPGEAAEVGTLDWANAQRTIANHGGTLSLCELEDRTTQVCLVLPWGL